MVEGCVWDISGSLLKTLYDLDVRSCELINVMCGFRLVSRVMLVTACA